MNKKRRVVITALGIVSSVGIGKEKFWQATLEGKSGIDLIKDFDTTKFSSKIASQIKDFNPEDYMVRDVSRRADRFVHLGLASAKLAVDDSGIDLEKEDKHRIGVVFGSGLGGILFHEEQILRGYEKGAHRLNPLCVPRITPNAVSSQIAIYFNLSGPNMVISNACASSSNAIGESFRKIQNQEADLIFTGGAEAPLTEFTFGAYDALKVLSRRNVEPYQASCPFDKTRDGFVLAEGAATLIVEDLEHALNRGAHIYAEIIGYNSNSGAYHMVIPQPEGKDIGKVMADVLKEADLEAKEINYINAHGTSTVLNDKVETKAIKDVFGEYAYKIPVSSTKSMLGHSIGATGAIEAAVCSLAIENQIVPQTLNYKNPDPECDLDYVPGEARQAKLNFVLSNSFGFGSNNVCLLFKKYNGNE
ncbi:MAG: beta-ketoacyl-ACP synthase II [Candidatus Omnitrophota bacterium]